MGVKASLHLQVYIEPTGRETALEAMFKWNDKVTRIELEAFLEEGIRKFLGFHFDDSLGNPDVVVTIE